MFIKNQQILFLYILLPVFCSLFPACASPEYPSGKNNEEKIKVGVYYFGQWSQEWLKRSSFPAQVREKEVWDLNRGYWIAKYEHDIWTYSEKTPVQPPHPQGDGFDVTVRNVEGGSRQPLKGWYDDAQTEILKQQVEEMIEYGIGYICFAWYYPDRVLHANPQPSPFFAGSAIDAYTKLPQELKNKMPYMLLWENSIREDWLTSYPVSPATWDTVIDNWIDNHFWRQEYIRIENKPVIVIYSAEGNPNINNPAADSDYPNGLREQYQRAGFNNPKEMLDYARDRVASANIGCDGIYFVLCLVANDFWVKMFLLDAGVDAITSYNVRGAVSNNPISQNFEESITHHEAQWKYFLANSPVPVWLPAWVGFNDTPWKADGVTNQNITPTLAQLETHLQMAHNYIQNNMDKTMGRAMIYAWNEYGEGGILEPTVGRGNSFLTIFRDVFKR